MDKTRTDFATVSKQAENLLRCSIFSALINSTDLISLSDIIDKCSQLHLGCESLENMSRILASKAVCIYSLATLEQKINTEKEGIKSLIFELLQILKEK